MTTAASRNSVSYRCLISSLICCLAWEVSCMLFEVLACWVFTSSIKNFQVDCCYCSFIKSSFIIWIRLALAEMHLTLDWKVWLGFCSSVAIKSSTPTRFPSETYAIVCFSIFLTLFLLKYLEFSLLAFNGSSSISWMFSCCSDFCTTFFVTINWPFLMI